MGIASGQADMPGRCPETTSFRTRDDVLTLLIHLGYLAYDENREEVFIPNQEIAQEYLRAMKTGDWGQHF